MRFPHTFRPSVIGLVLAGLLMAGAGYLVGKALAATSTPTAAEAHP